MKRRSVVLLAVGGLGLSSLGAAGLWVLDRYDVPTRLRAKLQEKLAEPAPTFAAPVLPPIEQNFAIAHVVYEGGLKNGWEDYGWAEREIKGPGPARLKLSKYAGWILAHDSVVTEYGGLVFRLKAPAAFGDFLEVRLESDNAKDFDPIQLSERYRFPAAAGYTQVIVPMAELNPHGLPFTRIMLRASREVGADPVFVDQLALTAPSKREVKRTFEARPAKLRVRCDKPGHRVSPLIFGLNDVEAPEALKASAYRWGGNPTTRYNWQLNAWNTGADWFFENVALKRGWQEFVKDAVARKAHFTITLPLIGWVAKDTSSQSFPVSVFGKQEQVDQWRLDAGNGVAPGGKQLTPGEPKRTSVAAPPEFVASWVKAIREYSEKLGYQGRRSYILDNEPMLWNSTHRDVHPEPLGYDELLDRTLRYASAVRTADPEAELVGPAFWGWPAYFWSAKDAAAGFSEKPDRRAHGDVPLLDWYLTKLKEHEARTGQRLLDVVDLHFYPQGKGVYQNGGFGATDPETNARRLRATRSLWDPSYEDESWIDEEIRLIPRLKEIIGQNYPGLKMSIGEWNFGAERHLSGALSLAETLGRLAEGGVHSAYFWTAPRERLPTYWAFRAFRNFDGQGGRFLDEFVPSEAAEGASLFVSRAGSRLVAIVLNLNPDFGLRVSLDTTSCGQVGSHRTYLYAGHPKGFEGPTSNDKPAIDETLPPYSIAVIDLKLKAR